MCAKNDLWTEKMDQNSNFIIPNLDFMSTVSRTIEMRKFDYILPSAQTLRYISN